MKKITFRFIVALIMLLLMGCGTISINIAVLKPGYLAGIRMEEKKYQELRTAFEQDLASLERQFNPDLEKLNNLYIQVADLLQKKADKFAAEKKDDSVLRALSNDWRKKAKDNAIKKEINEIASLNDQIRFKLPEHFFCDRSFILAEPISPKCNESDYVDVLRGDKPIPPNVVALLNNRRQVFSKLESKVAAQKTNLMEFKRSLEQEKQSAEPGEEAQESVDAQSRDPEKETRQATVEAAAALDTIAKTVPSARTSGPKSMRNDRDAYYVASAKDEVWSTRYNDVNAIGLFGNSDFIIVVDPDTQNLRMKGISFDPSKVAEVASKVTAQALIAAVSIAGVSLGKSPAQNAGADQKQALAFSNDALTTRQNAFSAQENQYVDYRRALIDIAKSIVEKKEDLNNMNKYEAATAAFKTSFEAHEKRLVVQAQDVGN